MRERYRRLDDAEMIDVAVFVGALLGWLILVGVLFGIDAARADDVPLIVVDVTAEFHGPEGSLHEASPPVAVPAGSVCDASAVYVNQSSTHPNTDIVLRSVPDELVIDDVELVAGVRSESRGGPLVSNGLVEVLVRLGPDEVSSGGFEVTLECSEPPTSTTSTTEPPPGATTTTTTATVSLTVSIDCIDDSFVVSGSTPADAVFVAVNVNGTDVNVDLVDGAFEATFPRGELDEGAVVAWLIDYTPDRTPSGVLAEATATIECPPEGGVPAGGGSLADAVALGLPDPAPRVDYGVYLALVGASSLVAAAVVLLVSLRRRRPR